MIERQTAEAVAAAQRGMARREDVRGKLDMIAADSLCIVGVEDAISPPAEMHEIAKLLAKSGDDDARHCRNRALRPHDDDGEPGRRHRSDRRVREEVLLAVSVRPSVLSGAKNLEARSRRQILRLRSE